MGVLLKEALKALCASNQWCYAVFWKIGCQNPKLLIWEECHSEPSMASKSPGNIATKFASGDLEGCWVSSENCSTQIGTQAEDRICSLISKMMVNNQINLVGEGLVGRSAFTGNHLWILSSIFHTDAHPPEVVSEVRQQFLAGMQTVAVIPSLPHGVVQLGSSLAIMENIGFVNDVKSLILRLGSVPGALLSENYTAKDHFENIGVPVPVGIPVSIDPPGNCKVIKSVQMPDRYNQPSNSFASSRLVSQLSQTLASEIQNNQNRAASFQSHDAAEILFKSNQGLCMPSVTSRMKFNHAFGDHLDCGDIRAEVIPLKADPWLKQQSSSCTGFNCQPGVHQLSADHGGIKLMEPPILPGTGVRQDNSNNLSSSKSYCLSELRSNGGPLLNCEKGSTSSLMLEGSCSEVGATRILKPISFPCSFPNSGIAVDSNPFGGAQLSEVKIHDAAFCKLEDVSYSGLLKNPTAANIPSGVSHHRPSADMKHTQNELDLTEQKVDNDLFQVLSSTLICPDSLLYLNEDIPANVHEHQKHEIGTKDPQLPTLKHEDICIRDSSSEDLFDVLGVEYKNKLLYPKWNKPFHSGLKESTKNSGASVHDPGFLSDVCTITERMPDGGTYSGISSDHLLDAVVSRGHSAAKQNSDDNVSCKTSITKVSSASVPCGSPAGGPRSMSDNLQRELFGLSKFLGKVANQDTSSFRSGCSKDDLGSCSQTTGYGHQISSWVEQSSSVNRDSSVSTAYSKRPDDVNKPNRKRLKPGENPRPRPKDRQMIQDRVKELREIVPNGAKCSIDALLERTIKHMLFLQSVTKHADKLKQTGESKIISKEGGMFLKQSFEGGKTWAYEVGSQSMVCPIIVEDLNPPRQMLVEMLCEERGFFLEIADLIRGLGLTILKGVMEAREDKIWARFAVEANRDVTRMEIFMSLVHLLEQTMKGSAPLSNSVDNNHMIVSNSFSQATPIPAGARPVNLQ